MNVDTPVLAADGLRRFQELAPDAINSVSDRFYATHGSIYAQFGPQGRVACREDLAFHLEFLRPVLEFGLIPPMVNYLRWLAGVLAARDIPSEHLTLSLDWLAEYFAAGMEGQDAQRVVAALHRVKLGYLAEVDAVPEMYELMPTPLPESEAFERALLSGNRRDATSLFEGCLAQGHSLVDAELHLVQPALYGVGRKWQNNQVTVAQEHLATAISQSLMIHGLMNAELPAGNGKRVLLACVEGNRHSVGLQMVTDAFQLAGWETQYLGADVPTKAVIAHVGDYKPDLLALSVSFAQQLRVVKEIIGVLSRAHGTARPSVIVGGLGINQFSPLASELGADGWSPDARAAVATAAALPLRSAS